jgi:hypothetical protein
MGERSDQITREIEETRGDLGSNLQELETKVKDATDWRRQFQKSPLTMIGIAFGGGILLSRALGGSSNPSRRYRSRDDGHEKSSHRETAGTRYEMKKAVDTWDTIKGALIGVAASKAKDFLRGAVPGFHEEYSKVEQHKGPQRWEQTPPQPATSSMM